MDYQLIPNKALKNFYSIVQESDGIVMTTNMHKRLAPLEGEEIRCILKKVVDRCVKLGKPVIVREGTTDIAQGVKNTLRMIDNCNINIESIDSFIVSFESLLEYGATVLDNLMSLPKQNEGT